VSPRIAKNHAQAPIQIVVTPGSGAGRALAIARRLQEAFCDNGYRVGLGAFTELDRLSRWARSRRRGEFSCLVCVGGDTTQSVAAGAALKVNVPLVSVPSGFGNMFAGALGLDTAPEAVVDLLEHGQVRRVDVGQAEGDLFLSHRTYGPLQQIEEAIEHQRNRLRPRWRRYLAYWLTGIDYLVWKDLPSIWVEVDGVLVSGDAAMVTIANVETFRGFLSLTPQAVPTDGLLDVFAMPRMTKRRMWSTLLRLWLAPRERTEGIMRRRGHAVRVAVNGGPADAVRILPGALQVLSPG